MYSLLSTGKQAQTGHVEGSSRNYTFTVVSITLPKYSFSGILIWGSHERSGGPSER